jgi:hypothetical protein
MTFSSDCSGQSSRISHEFLAPPVTRRGSPNLNYDPFLCATFRTVCGAGELYLRRLKLLEIVALCRPPPLQDSGRAGTAGNRFALDGK